MKYFASIALVACAVFWHWIIHQLGPKVGLVKPNFEKKPIMASYGIVAFPYIAVIMCGSAIFGLFKWRIILIYLVVMGLMWILGAVDDIFGNRDVGGFKGHFKKLIFERKLTTGAAKAIGGGLVGLATAIFLYSGDPAKWIPAALLIPLTANTINLVDLRPGRAVAVFFLGIVVICVVAHGCFPASWVAVIICAVMLPFAVIDSRGKAMMGDSGSNALGAAVGLMAATNTGIVFQWAAIMASMAIQLYSEKHSISALIERNSVLRSIDRRLGVR